MITGGKMSNIVIQGLWVGSCLSIMEQLSIRSFMKNGHEYHLYVYEDVKNVPSGSILKDANEVVPRDQIFRDEVSNISFSDLFRYKLLLEKGGYWADTDMVCLRPFDFTCDYVFAAEKTERHSAERSRYGRTWVNGCTMKVPADSSIMKFCYRSCLKGVPAGKGWELGPPILTEAVRKFELARHVFSHRSFTPINWWNWRDLVCEKLATRLKIRLKLMSKVYAVHLWDSMWLREGADKADIFHPTCLYEKLKIKYLS
jgi:mannosyltransferase OCH1-like enzyme